MSGRLFRREAPARSPAAPRIVIAERFEDRADLSELLVPLDLLPDLRGGLDVLVRRDGEAARRVWVTPDAVRDGPSGLRIAFPPFGGEGRRTYELIAALDADGVPAARLAADAAAMGIGDRAPITLPSPAAAADAGPAEIGIDACWVDVRGLFIRGWMHAYGARVLRAEIDAGAGPLPLERTLDRPDVAALYAAWPVGERTGFLVYGQWRPGAPILLTGLTDRGPIRKEVVLPEDAAHRGDAPWPSNAAMSRFIAEVNERGLVVAEIGSRRVSSNWTDPRDTMPGAGGYIGLDIHDGPGVDVTGDAHRVDELLGRESVDAAFSVSVIEHLARPWVFAASLNRALRIGGIMIHVTHQTWPLHEEPNDFWRFSDEALKLLFGPDFGFEVIEAGLGDRVSVVPSRREKDFWMMPTVSAFGLSYVLARKVRDVGDAPAAADSVVARPETYPVRPPGYNPFAP